MEFLKNEFKLTVFYSRLPKRKVIENYTPSGIELKKLYRGIGYVNYLAH